MVGSRYSNQPEASAKPQDKFIAFTAFDMGSTYGRKNPRASIAAFRKAFGDDPNVLMVLKVGHGIGGRDGCWLASYGRAQG